MSERQKRDHCIEILLEEMVAVLAEELGDEAQPVPPIKDAIRRLDRPAVLRMLVRTKPLYRPDMAGFLVHHRPDLNEYVGKCLEYLGRRRGLSRSVPDRFHNAE